VPTLLIDDEPQIPYVYFLPTPVEANIRAFAAAGIHLYSWGWSETIAHSMAMGWIGDGRSDYTQFDAETAAILAADPDARMFPRLAVSAPQWWLESHPDDRIAYEDGSDDGDFGKRFNTSLHSSAWLRDASAALEGLIRHVTQAPYADRIIGYQLTGGANEWFYTFGARFPDFSPASTRAFREWLRRTYDGDVETLRDAWRRSDVEFETAAVPTKSERMKTDVGLFRDPSVSKRVSDYYQFFSQATAEALIELCRVGKAATGEAAIFGAFYGYLLNAVGGYGGGYSPQHWGHQALRRVLQSPHVDFLCSPYQYSRRGAGGYDGSQSLPESAKLHGKLWLTECDHHTFLSVPGTIGTDGRPMPTKAETMDRMRRDFSHWMIVRCGMWWMDNKRGQAWYGHPEVMDFIRRSRELMERASRLGMRYRGEVAVVLDEETPFYLKPGVELLYPLVFLQERLGLARMGTTFDVYLHDDLAEASMPEYPLYIFLNTFYLTEEERRVVRQRVQCGGKTVVWMYAPGFVSEEGLSIEHVRELTGMRIRYREARIRGGGTPLHLYLTNFDHPITRGVTASTVFGTDTPVSPVFYCDDPEATVLGRLMPPHASGRAIGEFPGFAVKRCSDWTSVFVAVPNVPPDILRNLARFAGCHVYSDDGDLVYANSHFLAVHANAGGVKRIRLPRRTNVCDAFTGEAAAFDAQEFTDHLGQYATRLYLLGDFAQLEGRWNTGPRSA
jgi:hypothetical protein